MRKIIFLSSLFLSISSYAFVVSTYDKYVNCDTKKGCNKTLLKAIDERDDERVKNLLSYGAEIDYEILKYGLFGLTPKVSKEKKVIDVLLQNTRTSFRDFLLFELFKENKESFRYFSQYSSKKANIDAIQMLLGKNNDLEVMRYFENSGLVKELNSWDDNDYLKLVNIQDLDVFKTLVSYHSTPRALFGKILRNYEALDIVTRADNYKVGDYILSEYESAPSKNGRKFYFNGCDTGRLLTAIIENENNDALSRMLELGARPDSRGTHGRECNGTGLSVYKAAASHNEEALDMLFKYGANAEDASIGLESRDVLLKLVEEENLRGVELLLDKGLDPNKRFSSVIGVSVYERLTLLHEAISKNNPEMIKLLINYGAKSSITSTYYYNINRDPIEVTALEYAERKNVSTEIRHLLEANF